MAHRVEGASCRCEEGDGRGQTPDWIPTANLAWFPCPLTLPPWSPHLGGQDALMALLAPNLALVQVQGPPWMPTPQAALGLVLPQFFIRMQKLLPGNLETKAIALDCHQETWHVLAYPPSHPHRSRVVEDCVA